MFRGVAQAGGRVALGIDIDEQDGVAKFGQRKGEIDRGGGLTDSPLLIGNRNDPPHRPGYLRVGRLLFHVKPKAAGSVQKIARSRVQIKTR